MSKITNTEEVSDSVRKEKQSSAAWIKFKEDVLALQERIRRLDPERDKYAYQAARNDIWVLLCEKKYRKVLMWIAGKSQVYFEEGISFDDVLMIVASEISRKYNPNYSLLWYIGETFRRRSVDELRKFKEQYSLDAEDENGVSTIDKVSADARVSDPEKEITVTEEWNRIFLKFAAMVLNYRNRTKKGDRTRSQYFEKFYTGDLITGASISENILLLKYTRELLLAASVPFVNHVDRNGDNYTSERTLTAKDICEIYLKSEKDASWIPGEGERPVSVPTDPPLKLPMKNGIYRGYFAQVENRVIAPAIISQQLASYNEQKDVWRKAVEEDSRKQLIEDLSNFEGFE